MTTASQPRSFTVPPLHVVQPGETALDTLVRRAEATPDRPGFFRADGDGWAPITYGEMYSRAQGLAKGLIDAGVEGGDRVALMSRTRWEWTLWDYTIWLAGAVSVPIYETSSAEQVDWILSDSGAVAAIVETDDHAKIIESLERRPPALRNVWTIESHDSDDLLRRGRTVADGMLEERRGRLGADSAATIVYTSGTTGRPKGCTLTHENLVSVCANVCQAPGLPEIMNESASVLLFLPLAHVLARMIELGCVNTGAQIAYAPDAKQLPAQMLTFRPTLLLSVPRVFEKLYNTAAHDARSRHLARVFERAADVAVRYSTALDTGGPGLLLRLEHQLFDALIYRKLRAALGGRMKWSVSGGAPLGARLGHFFRGAGVTVLEGYGLTETAAGSTLNLPAHQHVGSVGMPIPGCEVRIADSGEVLIRAPFVMRGYWNNPEATAECIDAEGFLHTGDIGELDGEGFLSITGRQKELLVTSGGKNVAPTVLEDRLRAHELVSQCLVVGDAKPFIACLITLDPDAFEQWKSEHGRQGDVIELREDDELRAEIQRAVEAANAAVSQAEAIRRWHLLEKDFTEADGELTPTLKLKRGLIVERYREVVESLYV